LVIAETTSKKVVPHRTGTSRAGRSWPADALALLRGCAYAAGRTVEELAADLVERLDPDELWEDRQR
jgi:hypothetical protein